MDKKKTSPITYAVYAVGILLILYLAAALGLAFDMNKSESGNINFSGVMSSFETSVTDVQGVINAISNKSSYAPKLAYGAGFAIGIYALLKYTSRKRLHRKGVEHGSARWGTTAEAKKLADKPEQKKGEPKKKKADLEKEDNNIILSQEVRMSLNTRQHRENLNVLVIGGSGSGKSRFYVKPNIMQMNTSYVVTDPKGELLRSCGRLLEKNGYKVRVFNLIDMKHSNNYNPFAYIFDKKYDENGNETERTVNKTSVIKMINVLMQNTKQEGATGGDQFWDDATKALLTAISFYLLESPQIEPEMQNFAMVMRFLKLAEVDENDPKAKSQLDFMMDELESNNPGAMAVSYYKDFKKAAGETAKSILISCAVRLQAFNLPAVADLTHTDTISLETTGDVKTAIFIIIPSSDNTFNFLAAMMYSQLFDTLYDRANFRFGGRLPVHVRCLLDEFANVGTIPNFDKLIATMRSMEISANVIIQNTAQLKAMYEKTHEVIMGNCDSFIFLGGKEQSTLKMISELLGKETIDVVAQNRSKGRRNNSVSINNSIQGRELMTQDELSVMPIDRCIVMVRAFHPFYCHKFDIEKHRNYQFLEDSNKSFAYIVEDKTVTIQMPNTTYVPEDHVADEEEQSDEIKNAVGDILAGDIQKAGDIMSDIDIPDDDEVEVIEGENADMYDDDDEWHDIPDDDEEYLEFDDVSDFQDESISSYDVSGMVLDGESPNFDTSDEITYDSGLFYS